MYLVHFEILTSNQIQDNDKKIQLHVSVQTP